MNDPSSANPPEGASSNASTNPSSSNKGSSGGGGGGVNAFEWLAGGLFFGSTDPSHKSKRELQNIESSKDVKGLWNGLEENFQQLQQQHDEQAAGKTSTAANEANMMDTSPSSSTELTAPPPPPAAATTSDFLSARLSRLRSLLYEERKTTASPGFRLNSTPHAAIATVQFFATPRQSQPLPPLLWPSWIPLMHKMPFESRKVLTHIFCYLTVAGLDGPDADLYQTPVMNVFLQLLQTQFQTLVAALVDGYHQVPTDIALHCGNMYRSLLRHVVLYQQLVGTTESVERCVFPFLDDLVHASSFEVASDAMECVRILLAPPAEMADLAAAFMTRDYEALFDQRFVPKLLHGNEQANSYMTKRVALQILSTVLLTRTNYNVMVRFVASAKNLKVILLLLRHTSPHITLDAFHVFKVFVANPNKPPDVVKMLKDNQVKLAAYLKTLHTDKAASDGQFRDEKALIIATIEAL